MGGPQHAARQDAVSSSHQASANQVLTTDNSKLFQSEPSSVDVVQTPNHPSPPDLDQAWRTKELMSAPEEEKLFITQQELVENPVELVRTADVESPSADPELFGGRTSSLTPEPEPEREPSSLSRLSLFRGMELITKGRVLCEVDKTDDSLGITETAQNSSVTSVQTSEEVVSSCNFVASDKPQPVSAFSFLNF